MSQQEICRTHKRICQLYIDSKTHNNKLIGPFINLEDFTHQNENYYGPKIDKYQMVYLCNVCKNEAKQKGRKFLSEERLLQGKRLTELVIPPECVMMISEYRNFIGGGESSD